MCSCAQHPHYLNEQVVPLIRATSNKTILDLGCGVGYWGFLIRSSSILSKNHPALLLGVDLTRDYLKELKCLRVYDDLIVASASKLPFKQRSLDLIVAVEVLEHLQKNDGYCMLKELDRTCRERVVVSTPNGFVPAMTPINSMEIHRSGWLPSDLKGCSYRVMGCGFKIGDKYGFLRHCFFPLVNMIPCLASNLVAYKDYPKERARAEN